MALTAESHRILIADDEQPVREVLREFLENAGYEVIEAADGEEAVEVMRAQGASLILLDLNMPGMDGYTVLLLTKAHPVHRDVPIIVISGDYRDTEYRQYSEELGAIQHLVKPVPRAELLRAVETALEEDT